MGALQPMHLLIIAGVVLLVLGPSKLPQLARSIGESIRELKKSLSGVTESEPITMIREVGQAVNNLKADLNPLSPPRPRSGGTPSSRPAAPPAADPNSETRQS
jgi:sec-independent protein translocase protein TatA